VAAAGGKISAALKEVQPSATRFFADCSTLRQDFLNGKRAEHWCGAFLLVLRCFCSEKEQKHRIKAKRRQGATWAVETGCTLFALLHSIRAQGATSY
jgi:hypothetical protein